MRPVFTILIFASLMNGFVSQKAMANEHDQSFEPVLLACKGAPPSAEKQEFHNLKRKPELLKLANCYDDNLAHIKAQNEKLPKTSLSQAGYFYEGLAKIFGNADKIEFNNAPSDTYKFGLQLQEWLLFSSLNPDMDQNPISEWSNAGFDTLLLMPDNGPVVYYKDNRFLIFFITSSDSNGSNYTIISLEKTADVYHVQPVKMETLMDETGKTLSLRPAQTSDFDFDPVSGSLVYSYLSAYRQHLMRYILEGDIFRLDSAEEEGVMNDDPKTKEDETEDKVYYQRKHK